MDRRASNSGAQIERVDASVDLLDGAFGRRRIALLHDLGDCVIRPNDAPIAVRPIDCRRHHRSRCAGCFMSIDQIQKGGRRQERHVPGQEDQGPGLSRHQRLDLLQRVGGSALRLLQSRLNILVYDQMSPDLSARMSRDDGHCVGRHGPRGPNHMVDQGQAPDSMQHFREGRLHAGALPSRQDDYVRHVQPIGCVGFAQGCRYGWFVRFAARAQGRYAMHESGR